MLHRLKMLPLAAFIVLGEPLLAIAQTQQDSPQPRQWYGPGPWHMWGGDGYGWPFWWGGPFLMLLFWVLVIGCIIFMMTRGMHRHAGPPWADRSWGDPTHSALQILSERFARGDIQKEEYEAKKAALLSGARR
ncbi:MAG TPA: SHOCT domain-containing protein [Xanthobacteraceae bacterium]|jgi:putative membrane protein